MKEGRSVATQFTSQLTTLGFELPEWCLPPSETLVQGYEKRFALALPSDYREFLVHHGGVVGSSICDFQEPTPCGTSTCIDCFYGFTHALRGDDVNQATELIEGAPDVVAIGGNLMGAMFWLKCSGKDAGSVYMHDHEGRSAWPDKMFYDMFSKLQPKIKDYLELRRRGQLPKKPKGYDHVYRLASTFSEFVNGLKATDE